MTTTKEEQIEAAWIAYRAATIARTKARKGADRREAIRVQSVALAALQAARRSP